MWLRNSKELYGKSAGHEAVWHIPATSHTEEVNYKVKTTGLQSKDYEDNTWTFVEILEKC